VSFIVRSFLPQDQSAVQRLILGIQQRELGLALSENNQPDLKDIADYFGDKKSAFWVALDGDVLIGCVGLQDIGDNIAVMRKFMVEKNWRGERCGVASALLEVFENYAQSNSMHLIVLSTVYPTFAAQKFYQKRGYSRVERELMPKSYVPGLLDEVYFLKHLQKDV
jgi:N-acetylglutamate synthase-like GNAT family acetyltransferase